MQAHAVRLQPGDDLGECLLAAAKQAMERSGAQSAVILSSVGSLEFVRLRMASASRAGMNTAVKSEGGDAAKSNDSHHDIKEWHERLEILSLNGTFSGDGGKHLHMSVSDSNGHVWGGHFMAGRIFTTLELVIATLGGVQFKRDADEATGYRELVVAADGSGNTGKDTS